MKKPQSKIFRSNTPFLQEVPKILFKPTILSKFIHFPPYFFVNHLFINSVFYQISTAILGEQNCYIYCKKHAVESCFEVSKTQLANIL